MEEEDAIWQAKARKKLPLTLESAETQHPDAEDAIGKPKARANRQPKSARDYGLG